MGKMVTFRPDEKYRNYGLPTSKPFKSQEFYTEKVPSLQQHIYKKLKKVAELLESLYPKLTDNFGDNIKKIIEKNLATLIDDLNLLQSNLHNNPESFNTSNLKTNQHCIDKMKSVCDNLQTVSSYEHEFKTVGKIKHALHEIEQLIQPTKFDKSLESALQKRKPNKKPAKKASVPSVILKKSKAKSTASANKTKAISKKAKTTTKSKPKLKKTLKKTIKAKPKAPAKKKSVVTAKTKPKKKSIAARSKK